MKTGKKRIHLLAYSVIVFITLLFLCFVMSNNRVYAGTVTNTGLISSKCSHQISRKYIPYDRQPDYYHTEMQYCILCDEEISVVSGAVYGHNFNYERYTVDENNCKSIKTCKDCGYSEERIFNHWFSSPKYD